MLFKGGTHEFVQDVAPAGKLLLFGFTDILVLRLDGQKSLAPYLQTRFKEAGAVFSSNGRWIAYDSDDSGREEVYIQGFPEHRGKWLVSTEGGQFPYWRADGEELYWLEPSTRTVMATRVDLQ